MTIQLWWIVFSVCPDIQYNENSTTYILNCSSSPRSITFNCRVGYIYLKGNYTRVCQEVGKYWTGTTLECIRKYMFCSSLYLFSCECKISNYITIHIYICIEHNIHFLNVPVADSWNLKRDIDLLICTCSIVNFIKYSNNV